jgi:hypothetical protein
MHKMARFWSVALMGSVALIGCEQDGSSASGIQGDDAGISSGTAGAGGTSSGTAGSGGTQGGSTGESMPFDAGVDRPVDRPGDADAASKGGTTGTITSIGSYTVGETLQPTSPSGKPGTVTSITQTRSGYYTTPYYNVVITYPPAWTCPADPSVGTTPPGTGTPTDPMLSGTTCAGLAGLRNAGLKVQAANALMAKADALVRDRCNPTTVNYCVDSRGEAVETYRCYGYADAGAIATGGAGVPPIGAAGASGSGGGATDYSTTNNQVLDVDEADFVKNDANTIFVLSADGLHIIDAWPADQTRQLATVKLTGEPRRLFLNGNRLVVYTRDTASTGKTGAGTSNPSAQGCTYGYSCRFSSEGGHTTATVFDVTDPSKPQELMRYQMSGGYVASRRIGSTVYTVVSDTGAPQIPGLNYTISAGSYDELATGLAQMKAANDALIDAADQNTFLPWIRHVTPDGQTTVDSSCNQALATTAAQGTNFVSVLAFDLSKLEPMTRTIVGTSPGYVYASSTSLYVAVDLTPEFDYGTTIYNNTFRATNTAVHKFALAGTDARYVASVTLPGHILNQFAMDETDGVLRVASTLGWTPSTSGSFLTTFGEQDGKLVKLGEIGKIAPGEDIRSVRFDGKRGFVVTFRQTDPLFVFDLSDARAPKLTGELIIPGFSTYMHPLDESHLLAVGFDASSFTAIQIQIFDVTDLANPTVQSKLVVRTRGSGSEALTNHLAFNYFPSKKMLALPLTICDYLADAGYVTGLTFTGLMVFDISLDTGIKEHGRLPFLDPTTAATGVSCQTWWTNTSSLVKRSIFMDNWVYGISDTQLKVAGLDAMSTPLQTVSLIGP